MGKRKSLLSLLCAIISIFSVVGCSPSNDNQTSDNSSHTESSEEIKESEGLEYELSSDKTYYIVKGIGTCTDTKLVIPETYENLPVKEIFGSSTYSLGAFYLTEQITSVVLSDNITSIGKNAFVACPNLEKIVIGKNVASIGENAFRLCSRLVSIEIPVENPYYKIVDGNLYTKDGKCLVQYALGKQDETFVIPAEVNVIGVGAFSGCRSLTQINIHNAVTTIEERAFSSCYNLASIEIPDSVVEIGDGIFAECGNLKSAVMGRGVSQISREMFNECDTLQSVTFSNNVFFIGYHAFSYCSKLTSITFEGTKEEWEAIEKNDKWRDNSAITTVECAHETITLE